MLTHVQFQSIKSLLDVSVELAPFTVLVGPNGCGKSTFLDQLELLCRCTAGPPHNGSDLGEAGDIIADSRVDQLRTTGSRRDMAWRATTSEGAAFAMSVAPPGKPNAHQRCQLVFSAGKQEWRRASGVTPRDAQELVDAALAEHFGWRAQRLRLSPSDVVAPVDVRERTLGATGLGLASVLGRLARNDQDAYAAIQSDLRLVVPHFEKLQIVDVDVPNAQGVAVGGAALQLVFKGAGQVPATSASDGTLLALALLTATHNRELPTLVLMDDIDHGLHLGAQYEIVEAIRRVMVARPELQVICTTHSPVLLDSFKPEEVRVMALDDSGHTLVSKLTDHPSFEKYNKLLQTGELWATTGEDWVRHAHAEK